MAPERPFEGMPGPRRGADPPAVLPADLPHEDNSTTPVVMRRPEDDDLTSLTWLQDMDLLKGGVGFSLGAAPTGEAADNANSASVTGMALKGGTVSDGALEDDDNNSGLAPSSNSGKHPNLHTPYNPQIHIDAKPPYSFSCLIFLAIEDCPQKALPVKDIYAWILEHFPYYQRAPTGWKNSVRHNLSLNKCFRKVEKAPNLGKGSLWMVDPVYRPNLLQALRKAPFHPYTQLERVSLIASRTHTPSAPLTVSDSLPTASTPPLGIRGGCNMPNPDLFPYLSRRLAASGLEPAVPVESPIEDDVDAAAAMLALKHGPRILHSRTADYLYRNGPVDESAVETPRNRKRLHPQESIPVITSSPSEDHTYSAGPPGSPDSACSGPAVAEDLTVPKPDQEWTEQEERRKIVEGADALLNLAGVCVRRERERVQGSKRGSVRHGSPTRTSPAKQSRKVSRHKDEKPLRRKR